MSFLDLLVPFSKLLVFCAIVCVVILVLLIPISKRKRATYAVLKRNFVAYFSNPTGYVFICVFMLLSSIAAFWPQEFFSRNLATLDQLNLWFPMIMLVFIPAITMSIWSEERREGTDELLLTIPASDVDIVLGKYLAAVAIFSTALVFSLITNSLVLISLSNGDVDVGLLVATYIGYWFIGLAMLALGMVASFLTSNLTIAFLLGALFNAPLVFLVFADRLIPSRSVAQGLAWWSYDARFSDFGRGVISLSGITFFGLVAIAGVYLSVLLIGRRHWGGGRERKLMSFHYIVRALALIGIVIGVSKFFSYHDLVRWDVSSAKMSSLAPDTKNILNQLDAKNGILIEAFISRDVPQAYVEKKVDLVNMLREFQAQGGSNIEVRVFDDLEPFTDQATRAQEQYGIDAQKVTYQDAGGLRQEDLFLGAAFTSGLERVVIPFFDLGIPVEYELIRSIATVAGDDRKKIGVLKTDVNMFGGFSMTGRMPKELIIEELEKQYEVQEVDPTQPINEDAYDVLLAVQPSSLSPPQMENLVAAIRNGLPTAIFEDPYPYFERSAPGTGEPRRPQGGMFGMGQPPQPKGDIRRLWETLGIDMIGKPAGFGGPAPADVVWQAYNPYGSKLRHEAISPEWVFTSPNAPGVDDKAINVDDDVTSGLEQVLFLYPGAIRNLGAPDLTFTALVKTGDQTGEIGVMELRQNGNNPEMLRYIRQRTDKRYIIGARIRGYLKDDLTMSDAGSPLIAQVAPPPPLAGSADEPSQVSGASDTANPDDEKDQGNTADPNEDGDPSDDGRKPEIHVIYVSDIDVLSSAFIALRANPESEINWEFDNVPFVLNVIDSLAGDDSLLEIRKRKTRHSTLRLVDAKMDEALLEKVEKTEKFEEEYKAAEEEARARLETQKEKEEEIAQLQTAAQASGQGMTPEIYSRLVKLEVDRRRIAQMLEVERERLQRDREQKLSRIDKELELEIRKVQTNYKLQAAFLPLIPPFLVGLVVFWMRNRRERESVGTTRVR
jgi:ABC-2 type transport system permease protein